MKKILTAINNPNLNKKLSEEKFIEIPYKDIQYREAILEILYKDNNFNIIIINEKLPGEIDFLELIKKINKINKKIKIIVILEKENEEKENELKKININKIYYNNKINLNCLVKIIKEKEINKEEELEKEINKLKEIIKTNNIKKDIEKDIQNSKLNKKIIFNKEIKNIIIRLINNIKCKKKEFDITKKTEGIVISVNGYYASGKSTLTLMLANIFSDINYQILIIYFNSEEIDFYSNEFIENGRTKTKFYIKKNGKNKKRKSNNFQSSKKYVYKVLKINRYRKDNKSYKIKINYKMEKYFYKNIKILNLNKNSYLNNQYLNKIIKYYKNKFDYIFCDVAFNQNKSLKKEIIKNSNQNIIILEPNKIGILRVKKYIEKINKIYKVKNEKVNIIINKNNKNSINKEIISNIFSKYKILFVINSNNTFQKFSDNKKISRKNLIYIEIKNKILRNLNNKKYI